MRIDELMTIGTSGSVSANDNLNISFSSKEQMEKILDLINLPEETWREMTNKKRDSRDWTYQTAKNDAKGNVNNISLISYRPFDIRYTCYTGKSRGLYSSPQQKVMHHLQKNNIALCCIRINSRDNHTYFVAQHIVDKTILSSKDNANVFPLYLYTTNLEGKEEKMPNLNAEEWQKFNAAVGREVSPEELLHYIYGVLHSPSYRERYKEFLKIDFPRIPLPNDEDEFKRYGGFGARLIGLHLMRGAGTWQLEAQYNVGGSNTIEEVRFEPIMQPIGATGMGNVWINGTQYFGNVPAEAWNAYIGGYQPAQKWLKDRKGRSLTYDDIRHYLRIIHALSETQRIMREIG